jgi:hypothetical protein
VIIGFRNPTAEDAALSAIAAESAASDAEDAELVTARSRCSFLMDTAANNVVVATVRSETFDSIDIQKSYKSLEIVTNNVWVLIKEVAIDAKSDVISLNVSVTTDNPTRRVPTFQDTRLLLFELE